VLAYLCQRVYTIERLDALLADARRRFDLLKLHNIVTRIDDGTLGWPDEAPFDAIMVTAGGPRVPSPLVKQLADGGRMIIPVGDGDIQRLVLLRRQGDALHRHTLEAVRFVNLVGIHGYPA
jgi:protein-L-isoaspartate(D-aspartate) O-methyltransferase